MKVNKRVLYVIVTLCVLSLPSRIIGEALFLIAALLLLEACVCVVKYFMPIVMDISERNIFPWFPKNIFDREEKGVILQRLVIMLVLSIVVLLFYSDIVRTHELLQAMLFN